MKTPPKISHEKHIDLFGEQKVSQAEYRSGLTMQIKRARKEQGLTQQQLADIIGSSKATIARIEMGRANPKADTLSNISQALNTAIIIDGTYVQN